MSLSAYTGQTLRQRARRRGNRTVLCSALAIFALLSQGCSTVSPDSFDAGAPEVKVTATRAVSVVADLHDQPMGRFNANGFGYELNRDEFSREIAKLLAESLSAAGVAIDGEPQIRIRVDYMDFMFKGPCLLDYRVSLGDEEVFGLQSEGHSAGYSTACRRAIEDAVSDIANDPRTAEFLGGE